MIEQYLRNDKFTSREELAEKMKVSEREVRRQISELKTHRVVIYNSQTKGYRLAKELRSMNKEEREEDINLVNRSVADIKSRKKVYNKQLRKYIAYLKKAAEINMLEENENHIPRLD